MKRAIALLVAALSLATALSASGCGHQAPPAPAVAKAPVASLPAQPAVPSNAPSTEAQFLQNNSMPPAEKEALVKQIQKQASTTPGH